MTEDIRIRLAAREDSAALVPLVEQYWRFEAIEGFDAGRISALLERVLADAISGRAWIASVDGMPAGRGFTGRNGFELVSKALAGRRTR